jgi:hypothetical protein
MKKYFSNDFSFSNLSKEKEDHPIIDVLRDWSAQVGIKKRKKTKYEKKNIQRLLKYNHRHFLNNQIF